MDGDGRKRADTPGDGVPHVLARKGSAVFAVLGVVVMIFAAALGSVEPGDLIVMIPSGAVLGSVVGMWVKIIARARLGSTTAAKLEAARAAAAAVPTKVPDLSPTGRWARSYHACVRSVAAFHAVIDSLPAGAGRDWLTKIGVTLDAELTEALRLARLGENLEPHESAEPNEGAQRVLELLRAAEKAFADTADRAVAIGLDLRADSDFVRVRAQLDLLAEQAPNLRATQI
jgi:hypothetical protein